jgi:hypothetical protein
MNTVKLALLVFSVASAVSAQAATHTAPSTPVMQPHGDDAGASHVSSHVDEMLACHDIEISN